MIIFLLTSKDAIKKKQIFKLLTFVDLVLLKTFQNLNVSSPAPVTIASPSGDIACNTQQFNTNNYNE